MLVATSRHLTPSAKSLASFFRLKHHWNPGTLEQRLFRAVTQPVLPERKITPTDRYVAAQEELNRRKANPYRKFMVTRAREELFDAADNRMVMIFDAGYHKYRELVPFKNQVFKLGVNVKIFPNPILKEAAINTKWERLSELLMSGTESNLFMIGDIDSSVCNKIIKITKRSHFLNLLGCVIGHRILNVDETVAFSQSSLLGVQSQLLGTLEGVPRQTMALLSHHQRELSVCLQQLSSPSDDDS